ncbi:hypothetical protein D9M68_897830 [compost metagenome]
MHDVQRQFALRVLQPAQLQAEALGGIARAHARRVEALQQRQHGLHFLDLELEFFGQFCADFFE